MKRIRRNTEGIAAQAILIAIVAVVILVVLAVFVMPALAPAHLVTTITVIDPSGAPHVIQSGPSAALVGVQGIAVASINYATTFSATSSGYSQYTLTKSSSFVLPTSILASGVFTSSMVTGTGYGVILWWSQNVQGLPVVMVCSDLADVAIPAGFSSTLNVGTSYSLGSTVFGTGGNVASITASQIIIGAGASGCPGTGNFELTYLVQLTAQAVGQGSVPSSTYFGYWNVGVSVTTGSLTLSGSISSSTNVIPPGVFF